MQTSGIYESHLVLIHKASIIMEVQQYQQTPYCLEPVPILMEWLQTVGMDVSEDALYKKSLMFSFTLFSYSHS